MLTQTEGIARIVETVLNLPSSESIAEIPVHWDVEDCYSSAACQPCVNRIFAANCCTA